VQRWKTVTQRTTHKPSARFCQPLRCRQLDRGFDYFFAGSHCRRSGRFPDGNFSSRTILAVCWAQKVRLNLTRAPVPVPQEGRVLMFLARTMLPPLFPVSALQGSFRTLALTPKPYLTIA